MKNKFALKAVKFLLKENNANIEKFAMKNLEILERKLDSKVNRKF